MENPITRNIYPIGVTILLLLTVAISSNGQINCGDDNLKGFSMRIGGGLTVGSDYSGIGGLFSVQYSSQIGLFGIRYAISDRSTVDPMLSDVSQFQQSNEIVITYGIEKHYSILYLSTSAGLGSMWGNEQMVGGKNNYNVAVLPIEFQLLVRFSRFIGVGGMLNTSINAKKTLTSGMIVLRIGSFN
jgi:hypothetical protein